jgi:hypothetical protein
VQSRFNILSAAFRLANVPEIKDVLTGKVYIGEPPFTGGKEDVSLNLITNPNKYIQSGYGNINIYVPKLSSGRDNLKRFDELVNLILPVFKSASITTEKGTFYFQIEDDKGVFEDPDRDGISYYNLRFEFQTF